MRALVVGLAAMAALTGCAASPSATIPAAKEITITLKDGKATPNGERIEAVKGQHLKLTIVSDRKDTIHVHGYDREIAVTPGTTTDELVLDQVGRFEVESHEPAFTILQLTVS